MTTCPDTAPFDFLSPSSEMLGYCLKQMVSSSILIDYNSLLLLYCRSVMRGNCICKNLTIRQEWFSDFLTNKPTK